MRLRPGDAVVSVALATDPTAELLTVLGGGYGKRTTVSRYRRTRRGSMGVRTTSARLDVGKVVAVIAVHPDDDLLVTTKNGIVIRCPVGEIGVKGRATRGVRLQRVQEGDEVIAVARLVSEREEQRVVGEPPPPPAVP